jgi:hypothetical protein
MSLENFAALYAAMKAATNGTYTDFEGAFLRFGRAGGDGVTQIMGSLLGKNGPENVAQILHIPLCEESIELGGLKDCGIEPDVLIALGRRTLAAVMENLRLLSADIISIDPTTNNHLKTTPVEAYGAFRHGFKVAFPIHEPRMFINSNDAELFRDEDEFLAYKRKTQTTGELLYHGAKDASGKHEVVRISGPASTANLKQFVQMSYRVRVWITEFSQYASSLYGSVDGRYPYLVNFSDALGSRAHGAFAQTPE